jgi:hypothetical protein
MKTMKTMNSMKTLTIAEVRLLLQKRPAKTLTYKVQASVLKQILSDTKVRQRSMRAAEEKELAAYLEVQVKSLKGPFKVVEASCPHCDRHITFLDFVKTGIEEGPHDKAQLKAVLTGRAGAWLTIRGQDEGRPLRCATCTRIVRTVAYSEYSSSSYAYA